MKKIMFDIGHGGSDPGAVANELKEKDINLEVGLIAKNILEINYEVEVRLTRDKDVTLTSDTRVNIVDTFNPDLCVSIHHNAATDTKVRGAEVIHAYSNKKDDYLAELILANLSKIGMPTRRAFTKLTNSGQDWYYMIRDIYDHDTDAVIVEGGFVTNTEDAKLLSNKAYLEKEANAIVEAVVVYLNLKRKSANLTDIMGESKAKACQLVSYALKGNINPLLPNCTIEELAAMFIEEGNIEGVRGDIAWAQAIKETGYFKYGGIVLPTQNNYAGIGALNSNSKGQAAIFESPRIGVRAQIQHLKAYASTEKLKEKCVDPRFSLVNRGSAKYVEWLGYKNNPNGAGWAWPGDGYGYEIVKIMDKILKEEIVEQHWGAPYIEKMKQVGMITGDHGGLDNVTWAEFAKVVVGLLDRI